VGRHSKKGIANNAMAPVRKRNSCYVSNDVTATEIKLAAQYDYLHNSKCFLYF